MTAADHVDVFMRESAGTTPDRLHLPRWNRNDWSHVLSCTQVRRFRASDLVIHRGATDRVLYLVAQGALEVGVTTFDGVSVSTLARVGPGSVIGEQSFFDGEPRSANVWGTAEATLLAWPHEAFQTFGEAHPALARDFLFAAARVLSTRLRMTTIRVRR